MGGAASAADIDRFDIGGVTAGRVWSAPADQTGHRRQRLPRGEPDVLTVAYRAPGAIVCCG